MWKNEMLEQWRRRGGTLSIDVSFANSECAKPSAELDQALARAWAFSNINRTPPDCSSVQRDQLYVREGHDEYSGGYMCGALCGAGDFYRAGRLFGVVFIFRTGGFLN
jgi:hypothetical protein